MSEGFTPEKKVLAAFSAYDIHKSGRADVAEIETKDLKNVLQLLGYNVSDSDVIQIITRQQMSVESPGKIQFFRFCFLLVSIELKTKKFQSKKKEIQEQRAMNGEKCLTKIDEEGGEEDVKIEPNEMEKLNQLLEGTE